MASEGADRISGLGKETRSNGDDQQLSIENLSDEMLVKSKPVESLVLEVVTVGLFGELTIPTLLKKIDLARDCHEEFYRIHKHFLKRFAYLGG